MAAKRKPSKAPPKRKVTKCFTVRTAMGKTQAEFAELLGVVPSTIQSIEQGRREPSAPVAKLIDIAERHPWIFSVKTSGMPMGRGMLRGFLTP